jgi:hypothetical protein
MPSGHNNLLEGLLKVLFHPAHQGWSPEAFNVGDGESEAFENSMSN